MTEQRNALVDLIAACWKDEALKARFMADPKAVLAEYGMAVPDGMDVKVVENTDDCVHITMPEPPSGSGDLSDEELSNAAGGFVHASMACVTFGASNCSVCRYVDGKWESSGGPGCTAY
jgi:hypothetical protein